MSIFLRELRANVKSLVIWSVIIALFIMIAVAKFSAYDGNPEMLDDPGCPARGVAGRLQHAGL